MTFNRLWNGNEKRKLEVVERKKVSKQIRFDCWSRYSFGGRRKSFESGRPNF